MAKKYYKFLYEKDGKIVSSRKDFEWEIGKEYSVKGGINNCNSNNPTNGLHASEQPLDALNYVPGDIVAIVEAWGDSDDDTDKICRRSMKIVKAYRWTKEDSVRLAIYCAEQVIHIFEEEYPDDSRPRDAIKAAKAYLKTPKRERADIARAATYAADAAAYAGARAAYAATYAADAAGDAGARAAYAAAGARAAYAADAGARAAYAATYAADAAGDAGARDEINKKINQWMKRRINKLEQL